MISPYSASREQTRSPARRASTRIPRRPKNSCNLGTQLLLKGDLYATSEEFPWASKLLHGHPDPRMHLALTLEIAGWTDDALSTYRLPHRVGGLPRAHRHAPAQHELYKVGWLSRLYDGHLELTCSERRPQ